MKSLFVITFASNIICSLAFAASVASSHPHHRRGIVRTFDICSNDSLDNGSREQTPFPNALAKLTAWEIKPSGFLVNTDTVTLSVILATGLLSGLIVTISRDGIAKLDKLRAPHSTIAPLIGSFVIWLLYKFKPDLSLGSPTIASPSFSLTRQLYRTVAAILSVGSGISLAFAGPAAEIGMTVARLLSDLVVKSTDHFQLQQMICLSGAGAGFTANFNTPLAGIMYAIEIARRWLAPDVEASFRATSSNNTSVISLESSILSGNSGIACIALSAAASGDLFGLGILIAACGVTVITFDLMKTIFTALMLPLLLPARLLLVATVCSLLAAAGRPQALSVGFANMNKIVSLGEKMPTAELGSFLVEKLAAISLCSASGMIGGVFAPWLFVGSTVGSLTHRAAGALLGASEVLSSASLYAVAGAAGVIAAYFKAPLTATVLILELTDRMDLLLPLAIVTCGSTVLAIALGNLTALALDKLIAQIRAIPVLLMSRVAGSDDRRSQAASLVKPV